MRTVYVDTGAFIAVVRRRDQAHGRCAEHFRRLRADGERLVSCDAVIGESATRLRYDAGLAAALAFRRIIDKSARAGEVRIRDGDAPMRRAAFELMEAYADLPLSYADACGAVVAREARADAVFTLDNDFRVLGFVVEPP